MGSCASGLLQSLGPEFAKFVAVEKGKVFLDQKVSEVKNSITSKGQELKKQTVLKINEQEKNAMEKVKSTIAQIQKASPESLNQASTITRKSKQDLLGASQIKQQFQELRTKLGTMFLQQQKKLTTELENQATIQKQNLQSQRPKIPLYDQLPPAQQQKVFAQGQKAFGDQIKSQQDSIQKQLASKFDVNKLTEQFKTCQNLDFSSISKNLDGIIDSAKNGLSVTSLCC